jgi:hypothetical protein
MLALGHTGWNWRGRVAMTISRSFTFGTTPDATIREALIQECGEREYEMKLIGDDAEALRRVVNEGIDSHLTAVVRSSFHWQGHRLACAVDHDDLLVILRRLFDDGGEEAWSLRNGIISTLGIEEV